MVTAEQNLQFNDKDAIAYVYGDEVQTRPYDELDLAALEQAADVLGSTIEHYDPSFERRLILHQAFIKALVILNFARNDLDQYVHIEQLENGLEKVDQFIERNPNITDFGDLLFESGHIARALLDDPRLGYKYWHLCAEQAHAGCMNILAFNYFSGGYGIRQDIEKSYYWHYQTYLTGTRFHCAGVYSAKKAREILFLFPELSEEIRWQDWTPKIDELTQQLEKNNEDSSLNTCGKGQGLLNQYLYELNENNHPNVELLALAKSIIKADLDEELESDIVESFDSIGNAEFFDTSLNLLKAIKHPSVKCDIAFRHILYSRALKKPLHAEAIFSIMSEFDPEVCKQNITAIELMRTKGTW